MGQHLSVDRLVRLGDQRMVYLVDNLSRKWSRRKCWACGNKHTPNKAQSCDYCGQKLEDQNFLMTARWNADLFEGFEALAKRRLRHFGVVDPVYAFYRQGMLMAVYHYDDSGFLADIAAPITTSSVLLLGLQLCESLSWLHQQGVALAPFTPLNVLLMPDGSPRWFDTDVARITEGPAALYRDPAAPARENVRNLARMLMALLDPAEEQVREFLQSAARGSFPAVSPVAQQLRRLLMLRQRDPNPPRATPVAAMSDLGLYRGENQDAYGWRRVGPDSVLYVVADGMGGHADGALAARMATKTLLDAVQGTLSPTTKADQVQPLLRAAFDAANEQVYRYRREKSQEMGCTLTAVLVHDKAVHVTHVGDSRCYRLRAGKLECLTRDQTVTNALIDDGQITPEQAAKHPARHILVSAIGGEESLDTVQQLVFDGKQGDRLVLCSDGLHGEVEDAVIARHLEAWNDRQKLVRELVREAIAGGARDNVTVLLLDLA